MQRNAPTHAMQVTRWPLQGLGFGPAYIDRAGEASSRVWGHDGQGGPVKEYIDLMSGFGAVSLLSPLRATLPMHTPHALGCFPTWLLAH
jgi:hypothetical protein